MEFGIIIDKDLKENKTYITINYLTEDEEKSNREVVECAYIETESDDKEHIIDLATQKLKEIMEEEM